MKKVLVTGAAGTVGLYVVKYLLSEGKYDITALDLDNKKSFKKLNKYRKRLKVVYGDVLDRTLIEELIKEQDYVIDLATCLPPLTEFKSDITTVIEKNGVENIVRAINYYNPKCHLIYASTTSLYTKECASVNDRINVDKLSNFARGKYECEKVIQKKNDNYTIVRVPLVLGDLTEDYFIYDVNMNSNVEVISKEDAAYSFISVINNHNKVNKCILNIGGGEHSRIIYSDLIRRIMDVHGCSLNFLLNRIFALKEYNSPVLLDSDDSNKILNYRNDSLDSYFMKQKRRSRNRTVSKLVGKIVNKFLMKKAKK